MAEITKDSKFLFGDTVIELATDFTVLDVVLESGYTDESIIASKIEKAKYLLEQGQIQHYIPKEKEETKKAK
jgi:hypothetical protein